VAHPTRLFQLGEQSIVVTHPDYTNKTLDSVMVLADIGTVLSARLSKPLSNQVQISLPTITGPIEEVLTIGSYKPSDSSLGLERFSTEVVDAIDTETMARFGDGNVAAALTRLAGVAVTGGQYANVRGLDGRYIASTLNGFLMPTTDPLTRDVQLDIFPSGILKNIQVQKSYSSNLLGNTTGGALQINTRGLPDERGGTFKFKIGGNTEVTGKEMMKERSPLKPRQLLLLLLKTTTTLNQTGRFQSLILACHLAISVTLELLVITLPLATATRPVQGGMHS